MAYDLWYRRQTPANWARRSSTVIAAHVPAPTKSRKIGISCGPARSPKTVKGEIDTEAKATAATFALYNKAIAGDPKALQMLNEIGTLARRGNKRALRVVRLINQAHQQKQTTVVGSPDDPLAQLPAKERKAVAQLIVLRKRADAGDGSAQRIVEAVARLKIFVPPSGLALPGEPAKL